MLACTSCGGSNSAGARFCSDCGARLIGGAQVATRKTVTILFCDVKDSTALVERVHTEAGLELVSRFIASMEAVIARHEGASEDRGDGVMGIFGDPVLHEDDAQRAVRCALEMRDELEALNAELRAEWGEEISARYGIATGEVAFVHRGGRRRASGNAVNVANRLQTLAAPSEILIGKETARLVGRAARLEPLEPLQLRGKSEPVAAWRLLGVAPAGAVPRGAPAEHVVGRDPELQALRDALTDTVARRRCRLLTVRGHAGVGKSCLVRRFVHDAEDSADAVFGRCLSYGEGITFGPMAEALVQLAGDAGETAIAAYMGGGKEARQVAAHVARAVGFAAGSAPSEEIQWAFRRLLEVAAARRPLILVVEDVHWAKPMLLQLLTHVVKHARRVPLLVVCLARPELETRMPGRTIELEPLSDADSRRLLEWLDPETARDGGVRADLLDRADGNPFYLEQLVAARQETGSLGIVPTTMKVVIDARINSLPAAERAVIDSAAIEGRRFHRDAVSELLAPQRAALDEALVSLVRRDLVRPDRPDVPNEDGYRFAHILVRDAVYDLLSLPRRAELHERLARWLEARPIEDRGFDEIIGFHYEQAHDCWTELQSVRGPKQWRLGRAGAERFGVGATAASGRGELSAAVGLLTRAKKLLADDDPGRGRLLTQLGEAQFYAAELLDAERTLDEALRWADARGDALARAHALVCLLFARMQVDPGMAARDIQHRFGELNTTFTGNDDDAGLARLYRLQALVHWLAARSDLAEAAWQRAVEHAARAGDEHGRADALCWLASSAFTGPLPAPDGIARCESIRSALGGNRRAQAFVLQPLAGLWAMRGEFATARELLAESNAMLAELGVSMHDAVPYHEAFVELLAGDPARAENAMRLGYARLEKMGEKAQLADTAATLARIVYAQDRLDDAMALADESAGMADEDDLAPQFCWRMVRAAVLARRGDAAEATRLTSEALELVERTDWLNDRADVRLAHAEALAASGEHALSRAAVDEALALYERKGNAVAATMLRVGVVRPAMTGVRIGRKDEVDHEAPVQ